MITSFHELYQQYALDVYRFSYWLCGNMQEAEDVTSETFVRALLAADRIEAKTVKAYLLTIAKNLAFKAANRAKRFMPMDVDIQETSASVEQRVEIATELESSFNFMRSLPDIDRAALLLRIQEELSYEEIAQALNISPSAAKVRIHRARLKLAAFRIGQEENIK
jgi:RNA polymerase sigma-70 factor, ECF subfamily